ncbi:MAG: CDP-archaeol synthase [Clostridiales bacterium]|nr:CDP-archaeol synthase [Clostridiales bacterium]
MTLRIITGAALLALLFFALYFGGWVFSLLWIACVCIALHELFNALKNAGHHVLAWPTWFALIIAIPGFLLLTEVENLLLLVILVAVIIFVIITLIMFRDDPSLDDLMTSIIPLFAVALPGMSLLGMTRIEPVGLQRVMLSLAFFIPVVGDSLAFFVGSKYGKTKLNKAISPNKTIEGSLGGLVGSILAAVVIYFIGLLAGTNVPTVINFIVLGLLGGIAGQIGDLFASFVKRHCGIKDYSHIFPGHGGMMDRLDSILFAGTLVYFYQALPWI